MKVSHMCSVKVSHVCHLYMKVSHRYMYYI